MRAAGGRANTASPNSLSSSSDRAALVIAAASGSGRRLRREQPALDRPPGGWRKVGSSGSSESSAIPTHRPARAQGGNAAVDDARVAVTFTRRTKRRIHRSRAETPKSTASQVSTMVGREAVGERERVDGLLALVRGSPAKATIRAASAHRSAHALPARRKRHARARPARRRRVERVRAAELDESGPAAWNWNRRACRSGGPAVGARQTAALVLDERLDYRAQIGNASSTVRKATDRLHRVRRAGEAVLGSDQRRASPVRRTAVTAGRNVRVVGRVLFFDGSKETLESSSLADSPAYHHHSSVSGRQATSPKPPPA